MAKKKIYMTATATAAITAAFFGADQVDAATHKVKSGDTLWSLAKKYDTSVAQLKDLNNLTSDLIITNDLLEVGDGQAKATNSSNTNSSKSSTSSNASSNKSSTSNSNSSSGTYTVKSGDSLYAIAANHGMSVDKLMSANNLSSTMIHPGDKLSVNGSSASNTSSSSNSSSSSSANSSNSSSSSNTSTSKSGTTYTIKSGDTLGHIAANHNVSVDQLKSWNNLSSHLIFPGDKLTINGKSSSTSSNSSSNSSESSSNNSSNSSASDSSSSNSNSSSSSSSSSATTYTVKSGDSLSAIASQHGVTVNNLMNWNNLDSTLIFPGNKLAIKESAKKPANNNSSSNSSSNATSNSNSSSNVQSNTGKSSSSNTKVESNSTSSSTNSGGLISTAKSVQGTPYVWGGSKPGGFDCSGFIYWAHNNSGKSIPRTSVAGYDSRSYEISNPQVGDLVFFRGTYGGPNHMSHMGIYLGGGNFIHASSSQGVSIANVNNVYWSQYFDSYKRFY
ncbi:MAG TPA: LysM peptidoglycan-binding domain-containing protein [Pseudogracilibacillus sp.]|nr:LysM peptidoglycan-binding domain-containing protein [Pseudogracilibacillus sp.]